MHKQNVGKVVTTRLTCGKYVLNLAFINYSKVLN